MTVTASVLTPSQRAQHWLDAFGAALASGQPDAVLPLFDADCYWRDLVAFTWNIRTQEGHTAIRDMLAARQAETGA
jgi:putative flavoprotein involved in K+ transport